MKSLFNRNPKFDEFVKNRIHSRPAGFGVIRNLFQFIWVLSTLFLYIIPSKYDLTKSVKAGLEGMPLMFLKGQGRCLRSTDVFPEVLK
jgi:hypothetical protein